MAKHDPIPIAVLGTALVTIRKLCYTPSGSQKIPSFSQRELNMPMKQTVLSIIAAGTLLCGVSICPAQEAETKKTVEDVIPLTVANMRGHKMLYNEGWYIVSSSSKALDYAWRRGIVSSGEAIKQAGKSIAGRTSDLKTNVAGDIKSGAETARDIAAGGTEQTGDIMKATHEIAKAELSYASSTFKKAADAFVRGNLSLAKRTEEDRNELANLPGNYYKNIKSDFSNIWELTDKANESFGGKIEVSWDRSFHRASEEFRAEYERSGEKHNTLTALGPILYGYLKSIYHGLVAPSSKSIVKGTATTGSYALFLPVAATSVVAGRTVQSVGLTVYYVGKTGIKLVSPTVESGLLAGMSVLSAGAVPVTYAAGGAVGAVNQVAFTGGGAALGALEGAGMTAAHTATYVGLVAYDGVKGTTKVVINEASTGVVLGYNALTAIPAHTLEGALDTAVFLAWDGPRLVIAAARGDFRDKENKGTAMGPRDLPVGTVVDLKELEKVEGVKVEILSTDEKVIRDVLERAPSDLREAQ